jgi:hypothetical protein
MRLVRGLESGSANFAALSDSVLYRVLSPSTSKAAKIKIERLVNANIKITHPVLDRIMKRDSASLDHDEEDIESNPVVSVDLTFPLKSASPDERVMLLPGMPPLIPDDLTHLAEVGQIVARVRRAMCRNDIEFLGTIIDTHIFTIFQDLLIKAIYNATACVD